MTEEAKAARRAYYREWYRANKEKVKESAARHWEKKARELKEQAESVTAK